MNCVRPHGVLSMATRIFAENSPFVVYSCERRVGRDESVELEIATVFPRINCIRQAVVDIVRYLNEAPAGARLGKKIFCWMGNEIRASRTPKSHRAAWAAAHAAAKCHTTEGLVKARHFSNSSTESCIFRTCSLRASSIDSESSLYYIPVHCYSR